MIDVSQRILKARQSLDGLSVGDAFGEQYFGKSPKHALELIESQIYPRSPWKYSDDTEMASAIVEILHKHGEINQSALAQRFKERYEAAPDRGYGPGARRVLQLLGRGVDWETASRDVFKGQGSFGNGAAMRSAPIGAYFFEDPIRVVEQAKKASEITHAHSEGIAGGIAIALAAAWMFNPEAQVIDFFHYILAYTPESGVYKGIKKAMEFPTDRYVTHAAVELGNGSQVSAQDTVPFTLWCANKYKDEFAEGMWKVVEALGDRDTNCAIVGGIISGTALVPPRWLASREPLKLETI